MKDKQFKALALLILCQIFSRISAGSAAGTLTIFSSNYLKSNKQNNIFNQKSSYNNSPFKNYKQYLVARSSNYSAYNKPDCPNQCVCKGLSIDCSNRNLAQVPQNIPLNVIRV